MDYALVITFALFAAWAVLRVIGGERERRVRDLAHTIASAPPAGDAQPPVAQIPVASPVRGKPVR